VLPLFSVLQRKEIERRLASVSSQTQFTNATNYVH